MSLKPWEDWTPGVLSKGQVGQLCEGGYVTGVSNIEKVIDHSSLDLTLTGEGFCMPEGAVKPSGPKYLHYVTRERLAVPLRPGNEGVFTLEPRETYLFKLRERLEDLRGSAIHGQATAKSSVGRVDVLARLIVDGMDGYESFSFDHVASGDLYLEITPLTFRVCVKEGISLSQLRFFYGSPRSCEIVGEEAYRTFLKETDSHDGTLSVDLTPTTIRGQSVVAFCAQEESENHPPIPLWRSESAPDPCKFWRFVHCDSHKRLSLRKGLFYILRSKEKIALPKGVAVYCRAIDETFGEMRIHYAGFVHPLFGRERGDGSIGTPLIFEVRGHDVHVSLQHGERMARLIFYRMSEDATSGKSNYENQTLQLSKFFATWPERISVDEHGVVHSDDGDKP